MVRPSVHVKSKKKVKRTHLLVDQTCCKYVYIRIVLLIFSQETEFLVVGWLNLPMCAMMKNEHRNRDRICLVVITTFLIFDENISDGQTDGQAEGRRDMRLHQNPFYEIIY